MPLYQVSVVRTVLSSGLRLEKGMSVQVVLPVYQNPLMYNSGTPVKEAFWRVYGIDVGAQWTAVRVALKADLLK